MPQIALAIGPVVTATPGGRFQQPDGFVIQQLAAAQAATRREFSNGPHASTSRSQCEPYSHRQVKKKKTAARLYWTNGRLPHDRTTACPGAGPRAPPRSHR